MAPVRSWGKWTNHSYLQPPPKKPTSPSVSQDCMVVSLPWPIPWEAQHLLHRLCYGSDSQRTGNPCLGTWEDGSEAAAYMALSCPVASNDSIPPAGFHHHGALQCSEQHPVLETRNPENWGGVKPLPHKPWGHLDFNNSSSTNKSGLSRLWASLG